ncbi:MAG: cytochrome C, partial [Desulfofustis sp.]|nr:cytochrome C [Desulfofustis sp.]
TCIDCHHPEKRDYLEDKKGRKIDFDHSYQLCGQCHFRQKRDWLGGAHGKRVTNWAGDRVVFNCTTCHNPHSPRFEKRFPATYSVPIE